MGNNRQMLKNNLEQDLGRKIKFAEDVILQLRSAVQNVEENSAKAKGEVHQAVDAIQQLLLARKLELTRQIDVLCHSQMNALQEGIQTTFITLGSLQSMLSNLDSFDHSQLLNLHIPDISWTKSVWSPTPLEVIVNDASISKELQQCVNVNAKGLKGLIDVGSSASLPKRFVDYCDIKGDQQSMCHKSVHSGPPSVVDCTKLAQAKKTYLPEISTGKIQDDTFMAPTPDKRRFEQWLAETRPQCCPEDEDFELVSGDYYLDTEMEEKDCTSENQNDNKTNEDGGSSIVCIDKENSSDKVYVEQDNALDKVCIEKENALDKDLSKWLKPKKIRSQHSAEVVAQANPVCVPVLKEANGSNCTTKYAHNPWNNQYVDFPCLRMDPKNWIPNKKSKSSPGSSSHSSEVSLNFSQTVTPPTYNLPAPFWLKKYR